jgi:hypothetical protein
MHRGIYRPDADAMSEMHDAASPDECDEFTAFHAKGPSDHRQCSGKLDARKAIERSSIYFPADVRVGSDSDLGRVEARSVHPSTTDIVVLLRHVRFVPNPDIAPQEKAAGGGSSNLNYVRIRLNEVEARSACDGIRRQCFEALRKITR